MEYSIVVDFLKKKTKIKIVFGKERLLLTEEETKVCGQGGSWPT